MSITQYFGYTPLVAILLVWLIVWQYSSAKPPPNRSVLFSTVVLPAVFYLLLSTNPAGLDNRPSNTTCLAEDIVPSIRLSNAFPNIAFSRPLVLKQPPNDNSRFMIAEQSGLIQVVVNGVKLSTPFLDISQRVSSTGERGLLGLAFHPQYTANGYFYVSYTDNSGDSVISRFTRLNNDANKADVNSGQIILTVAQPYANHNGGQIDFGSDGYLYIGFGDGGSGGDPQDHGQDLSTWLGSLLRINVNSGSPYAIPPDNPFAAQSCNQSSRTGTCPEIYAYGLRNPWRWSFDSLTHNLWLGDVGQNSIEEINLVNKGDNLGWRCYEGSSVYNSSGCGSVTNKAPVAEYSHTQGRCSVTGGYVYRGSIQSLRGTYLYADYCSGEIWGMSAVNPNNSSPKVLVNAGANVNSFAQDNNLNVYVLKSNGEIARIDQGTNGTPDPIPNLLSQTGCVSSNNISQPAAGLIPYDINAPFWSDGADKSRWMALPNNSRINNADNNWSFPVGTVLMKKFEINNKPIETRLFKRHPNGVWRGYTYQWNDTATEATRVIDGKTIAIPTSSGVLQWTIPSETECLVCHTAPARFSLGLETAQLNKSFVYPTTGRTANQLDTLSHINLFTHPIESPASLAKMPNPYNPGHTFGQRARAWLHTNCSSCHRPGSGNTNMDLRYSRTLSQTNTCNRLPTGGNWGLIDPRLILPGDASRSLIHFRANSRDPNAQMPPLATNIADTEGMNVLSQWINSLTGCN